MKLIRATVSDDLHLCAGATAILREHWRSLNVNFLGRGECRDTVSAATRGQRRHVAGRRNARAFATRSNAEVCVNAVDHECIGARALTIDGSVCAIRAGSRSAGAQS